MQASGSREQEYECMADHGRGSSNSGAEEGKRESPDEETHVLMDSGLFQPIQPDARKKYDKIFCNCLSCFGYPDSEFSYLYFLHHFFSSGYLD
jgi:hypothetical protein